MQWRKILILICRVSLGLTLVLISQTQAYAQSQGRTTSILPTDREIEETNARLPILVGEGTMFTKVEYDRSTKTQRFYYRFTQALDKNALTPSVIKQLKENMKMALRQNTKSMARIDAGMTYRYIYCSIDNKVLYEIMINKSDF